VSRSNQSEHWKGPCAKNELFMDHSQYKLDDGCWYVRQKKLCYVTDTHIQTYHAYGYNEARFQRDSQNYLWLLRYSLFGAISRVNLVTWMLGCWGFKHIFVSIFDRPPWNTLINLKLSALVGCVSRLVPSSNSRLLCVQMSRIFHLG